MGEKDVAGSRHIWAFLYPLAKSHRASRAPSLKFLIESRKKKKDQFMFPTTPLLPGVGSTYTQGSLLGVMRLSLTLNIPRWALACGFMALTSGPLLPESWELTLRRLEASHMLDSFGLKCSKSPYYGP